VRSERVVHHKALFFHLCRRRGSAPCEVDGIAAGKVEDVEEMEAALPAACPPLVGSLGNRSGVICDIGSILRCGGALDVPHNL
jgi:hypothetical protein